jgi:formate dehydrogenase subunit beta
MKTYLPIENQEPLKALQSFFSELIAHGYVDALLLPMRMPSMTIAHSLVSDPHLLEFADPLAPVLPNNAATLIGQLSIRQPRPKVGAVVRACEARALIELVKMQQASLEDVVLITIDCAGTYNVPTFIKKEAASPGSQGKLWKALYEAVLSCPEENNPELRSACQICEQPTYSNAPIAIELLGTDIKKGIPISLPDEMGAALGYQENAAPDRTQVLDKFRAARQARRDQAFTSIRQQVNQDNGIQSTFAACIRCHNCMTVCPICYCKTCVFKSLVFDHSPFQYSEWVKQKGAFRMPADTTLFHLTRMNHMALSCVGCGMCTEACPAELPVGVMFRAIGQNLQEAFSYLPGRDANEPLPLITFKADEWTEVGE